ncbi:MAG: trypsin-like serine protease [Deltaproteobacteria bacterium]|nr:trypsin-like serine protease [Deltaproteobacteria bacterium]
MRHLALGCGVLGVLAASACVVPDQLHEVEQEIVGGQSAQISEFPTLGRIEDNQGWFCAGVLIDKDWVLTTAGCMLGSAANSIKVRFDDTNANDNGGGKAVTISAIQRHPQFNENAWGNDIALLKLTSSLTDRNPTPILRSPVAVNTTTTQAGWGDTGSSTGNLRKLVTPTNDCADIGFSNKDYLCFNAADGTATCYGDGGAPAYVTVGGKTFVAGVASGGTQQSCTAGYNIFTSAPGMVAFIDQFVPKVVDPSNPDPMEPTPEPDPNPADPVRPQQDPNAGKDFTTGGCSAGGTAPGGWLLAIGGALLVLRRRRRA